MSYESLLSGTTYIPDIYGESRVIDEREALGEAVYGSYVNAWREAPEQ